MINDGRDDDLSVVHGPLSLGYLSMQHAAPLRCRLTKNGNSQIFQELFFFAAADLVRHRHYQHSPNPFFLSANAYQPRKTWFRPVPFKHELPSSTFRPRGHGRSIDGELECDDGVLERRQEGPRALFRWLGDRGRQLGRILRGAFQIVRFVT